MRILRNISITLISWVSLASLALADIIDFAQFESYVLKSMAEWHVPGAVIVIVHKGETVYIKGLGTKTINQNAPVSSQTVFPLASLTKTFTVMVIAKLVEEGKLHWDDKVRTYYPEFTLADEQASADFTIRDLLSHRSGLPGFAFDSLLELGWPAKDVLTVLNKIPLKNPFRQAYDYQNIFPGIAGIIIERITGKPLSSVYQEYLFTPLGFQDTTIGYEGLTGNESILQVLKAKWRFWRTDMTAQHQPVEGKPVSIPGGNPTIYKFEASRGINSSGRDLAKWLTVLLNNKDKSGQPFLKLETIAETRKPHIKVGPPQGGRLFPKDRVPDIDYGMGWFIHKYDQLNVLSHMGGMTGIRSIIAICPEEQIGIVVVSNIGGMRVSLFSEAIRSKFFDMYLKLPDQRDWSYELLTEFQRTRQEAEQKRQLTRLKNPLPIQDLTKYVGTYANDLYGKLEVILENGHLFIKYRDLPKTQLTHWNGDNFTFKAYELTSAYSGNDYGDVAFGFDRSLANAYGVAINLFHEGQDSLFQRIPS